MNWRWRIGSSAEPGMATWPIFIRDEAVVCD
jgi:hypothetical protein